MHDGLEQAALVEHHVVCDAHLGGGTRAVTARPSNAEAAQKSVADSVLAPEIRR